jgi:hypothetical protein
MDTARINVQAVRDAMPADDGLPNRLDSQTVRLAARVRELEEQLRRERSRAAGLERGLSALSERVLALRKEA